MKTPAKNLTTYLVARTAEAERLLIQVAAKDENIRGLYEERLASIFSGIKSGNIGAPSSALSDYWYYFSPEGPWNVWSNFPELVSIMAAMINLLELRDDNEFREYCRRHGIDDA